MNIRVISLLSVLFLVALYFLSGCEKEKPDLPVVVTSVAVEAGASSAVGGGEVTDDGGGRISGRGLVWSRIPEPELDDNKDGYTDEGEGTGAFTSTMTGLEFSTQYYVRAWAANSAGTAYGEEISFTTLQDPVAVILEGHAFYAGTRIPVSGVTVSISGQQTLTGEDGYYRLEELQEGTHELTGAKDGYETHMASVNLSAGSTTQYDFEISSQEYSYKLTGTVSSIPFEEPLVNVKVVLMNPDNTQSQVFVSTDQEGNYTLEPIPRGLMQIGFFHDLYAYHYEEILFSDADQHVDVQLLFRRPIVETLEVHDIYASIAFGGGEVSYEGSSPVFRRGLVWSKDTIYPEVLLDQHSDDGGGGGVFETRLTRMDPQTRYYIRAFAVNAMGTSYGDTISIITNRDSGRPCPEMEYFTDPRDGTTYTTVQIGDQCWLRENLSYLPEVYHPDYGSTTTPIYYVYDYLGKDVNEALDTEAYANYGVLYNWPAAMTACPPGWRLPSSVEFGNLSRHVFIKYDEFTEASMARVLKSCRQVDSPLGGDCDTDEHPRWDAHEFLYGTNEFGFSALPGGRRHPGGYFTTNGMGAYFWTSTAVSPLNASRRSLHSYIDFMGRANYSKTHGYSVRCILDQ